MLMPENKYEFLYGEVLEDLKSANGMLTLQKMALDAYENEIKAIKEHMEHHGAAYAKMLEVLKEVQECSEYWSEYCVPLGIHERIANAIKAAEDVQ